MKKSATPEMVRGVVLGDTGLYDHERRHYPKGSEVELPASMAEKFRRMDVLKIMSGDAGNSQE